MEQRRKQERGWHGHFRGFSARLNCEEVPVIPAWLVRSCLDDPRGIPYLLVWKHERDGKIMEAVRLARQKPSNSVELKQADPHEYVEVKRTNGSIAILQIVWRTLPRNGGRALLLRCPYCETPRRQVYGWEWDSFVGRSNRVRNVSWRCRLCAQLRYSSEGGGLIVRFKRSHPDLFAEYGLVHRRRPKPWVPSAHIPVDEAGNSRY